MEYVAARSLATEQYHYQEALDSQGGDLFSQLNNITIKRLLIAKGVISSVTESHFSYFSGLRGGGGGGGAGVEAGGSYSGEGKCDWLVHWCCRGGVCASFSLDYELRIREGEGAHSWYETTFDVNFHEN